jgi:hypothetical protein
VECTFAGGAPVPTHEDGAPAGTTILAMGLATLAEADYLEFEDSLI